MRSLTIFKDNWNNTELHSDNESRWVMRTLVSCDTNVIIHNARFCQCLDVSFTVKSALASATVVNYCILESSYLVVIISSSESSKLGRALQHAQHTVAIITRHAGLIDWARFNIPTTGAVLNRIFIYY